MHKISLPPARLCPLSKSISDRPTDGPTDQRTEGHPLLCSRGSRLKLDERQRFISPFPVYHPINQRPMSPGEGSLFLKQLMLLYASSRIGRNVISIRMANNAPVERIYYRLRPSARHKGAINAFTLMIRYC